MGDSRAQLGRRRRWRLPAGLQLALAALALAVACAPARVTASVAETPLGCHHRPFDLTLVLDSSGSIGPDEWQHELDFAAGLVLSLPVRDDTVR